MSVTRTILALALLLPTFAFAAPSLIADTSRPEMSTFALGEPVTLTFTATGLSAADRDLKLLLDLQDEHAAPVLKTELPVTPNPDRTATVTFAAPSTRLGFYRVFARLSTGVALPKLNTRPAGFLTYCVVPDPARRPEYSSTETRFGMQGGFCDKVNVLPYLGIRWVLGDYNWRALEPDRAGQFAEARAAARAKGENARPTNFDWCKYPGSGRPWRVYQIPTLMFAPKWPVLPETSTYCTGTLTPDGEKAWRAYCLEAARDNVEKYPDLPERIYQVTWEPVYPWGFKGTDEQLIRIYEIAYPALHEADPKAVVLGPTGGGCTRDAVDWNLTLFRKGLGRYVDAFSTHPYHPIPPERLGMIDRLRELKEGLRQYVGRDLPLFATEEGNATGEDPARELDQARGLIREALIVVGEGFRVHYAFYSTDYPAEPGYGYYYNLNPKIDWGSDKVGPKPVAPAFAAMTFLLEGHSALGPIEWLGDTAVGYVFERGDDVILVLWDWGDSPRTVSIPVGVPRVQLCDWMGNAEARPATDGSLNLTLGPEPVYLRGVSPVVWGSHGQKPLRLAATRLTACPGTAALISATVTPAPGAPFRGALTLRADDRLGLSPLAKNLALPGGKPAAVQFSLKLPPDIDLGPYPVRLTLSGPSGALASSGLMLSIVSPVAVDAVDPLLLPGGKHGLRLALRDVLGSGLRGNAEVRLRGVPESRKSAAFTLAPKGRTTVDLSYDDLAVVPSRQYDALVTLSAPSGYRLTHTAPVNFTAAPRLAAPSDLQNVPPIFLGGREAVMRAPELYHGPADLAATARFAWDARALYLAFDVTDDVFLQDKTGFDTWWQDCVQVAFDLDPRLAVQRSGNLVADVVSRHRHTEVDLALTRNGPEAFRTITFDQQKLPCALLSADQVKLSIVRDGTRVLYQAAIPWTALGATSAPSPGSMIGLAATVNDSDDPAQKDPKAIGLFGGIYPTKDPARFGLLLLAAGPTPSPHAAEPSRLTFSGVLGQSQSADTEPLPFLGASGAAIDRFGKLWTAAGNRLYRFSRATSGAWSCTSTVSLPTGTFGPRSDGDRLFFICSDWKLYALQPSSDSSQPAPTAVCSVPENLRNFAVAPAGLSIGFAASAKFFALSGDAVTAFSADGKSLGVVLTLTRPKDVSWWYTSVAVEPTTGDLLVGSYWPDTKIYRFRADGSQVTSGGWPRIGHAEHMAVTAGVAWALIGGGAVPLAQDDARPLNLPSLQAHWTYYPNGLAADPSGGYWLATTQGLVHFDRRGRTDGLRLGGISGVRLLSVAPDGTLVAAVEGGQRMIRLFADDTPSAPLSSDGNEPFRVAAGWSDKACALSPAGAFFAVLDETARQVWAFDPWHPAWGEKPWVKLTDPAAFTAPRLLALGDGLAWIADGPKLLEVSQSAWSAPREVKLPGMSDASGLTALSAAGDRMLVAATSTAVSAYSRAADGSFTLRWQSVRSFQKIRTLAAAPAFVAVADAGSAEVVVLDAAAGNPLATATARDVPGGMAPAALAVTAPWLIVADETGSRLLRFRFD
jgi:hypothetical protein